MQKLLHTYATNSFFERKIVWINGVVEVVAEPTNFRREALEAGQWETFVARALTDNLTTTLGCSIAVTFGIRVSRIIKNGQLDLRQITVENALEAVDVILNGLTVEQKDGYLVFKNDEIQFAAINQTRHANINAFRTALATALLASLKGIKENQTTAFLFEEDEIEEEDISPAEDGGLISSSTTIPNVGGEQRPCIAAVLTCTTKTEPSQFSQDSDDEEIPTVTDLSEEGLQGSAAVLTGHTFGYGADMSGWERSAGTESSYFDDPVDDGATVVSYVPTEPERDKATMVTCFDDLSSRNDSTRVLSGGDVTREFPLRRVAGSNEATDGRNLRHAGYEDRTVARPESAVASVPIITPLAPTTSIFRGLASSKPRSEKESLSDNLPEDQRVIFSVVYDALEGEGRAAQAIAITTYLFQVASAEMLTITQRTSRVSFAYLRAIAGKPLSWRTTLKQGHLEIALLKWLEQEAGKRTLLQFRQPGAFAPRKPSLSSLLQRLMIPESTEQVSNAKEESGEIDDEDGDLSEFDLVPYEIQDTEPIHSSFKLSTPLRPDELSKYNFGHDDNPVTTFTDTSDLKNNAPAVQLSVIRK